MRYYTRYSGNVIAAPAVQPGCSVLNDHVPDLAEVLLLPLPTADKMHFMLWDMRSKKDLKPKVLPGTNVFYLFKYHKSLS